MDEYLISGQPLISVIIPVYNAADYLGRCLDSVLANTYHNLEVICVNDGSTDNSPEILRKYAVADRRVRIIDQQNSGVSAARNAGLDSAAGAFVAFIDSDDYIHSQFFEAILYCAVEYELDLVICGLSRTEEKETALNIRELPFHVMDGPELQRASMRFFVHSKLYRRETIHAIRFNADLNFGEDTYFNQPFIVKRLILRPGI